MGKVGKVRKVRKVRKVGKVGEDILSHTLGGWQIRYITLLQLVNLIFQNNIVRVGFDAVGQFSQGLDPPQTPLLLKSNPLSSWGSPVRG